MLYTSSTRSNVPRASTQSRVQRLEFRLCRGQNVADRLICADAGLSKSDRAVARGLYEAQDGRIGRELRERAEGAARLSGFDDQEDCVGDAPMRRQWATATSSGLLSRRL